MGIIVSNSIDLAQKIRSSRTYTYTVFISDWRAPSREWCRDSLQGKYVCVMHYWYFELKEDAILFKLTWG